MAFRAPNDFAAWLREITRRGQTRYCASLSHFQSLSISALEGRGRDHGFAMLRCDCYLCDSKLPQARNAVKVLATRHATTASHGRLPRRTRRRGGSVRRSRRTAARLQALTTPSGHMRGRELERHVASKLKLAFVPSYFLQDFTCLVSHG